MAKLERYTCFVYKSSTMKLSLLRPSSSDPSSSALHSTASSPTYNDGSTLVTAVASSSPESPRRPASQLYRPKEGPTAVSKSAALASFAILYGEPGLSGIVVPHSRVVLHEASETEERTLRSDQRCRRDCCFENRMGLGKGDVASFSSVRYLQILRTLLSVCTTIMFAPQHITVMTRAPNAESPCRPTGPRRLPTQRAPDGCKFHGFSNW
ncbi:hypothetical protein C8R46DRAFT_1344201 [Mycena filopes]|nr:hypothetical protein C8R46DRAFT_1344201 [Mycena filopes]